MPSLFQNLTCEELSLPIIQAKKYRIDIFDYEGHDP